jgi:hypothetical protein
MVKPSLKPKNNNVKKVKEKLEAVEDINPDDDDVTETTLDCSKIL